MIFDFEIKSLCTHLKELDERKILEQNIPNFVQQLNPFYLPS